MADFFCYIAPPIKLCQKGEVRKEIVGGAIVVLAQSVVCVKVLAAEKAGRRAKRWKRSG